MADYNLQYQDTYIDALLATANELKTAGYIYKGVATPSTNPGTPTERVAYLASEPGTYTNFGGIVIVSGLYSLTYAGGTWTGTQMSAGSDIEVVQTTGDSTTDVMSQKAVTEVVTITDEIDLTAYTPINYAISSSTKKWTSTANTQMHILVRVNVGNKYLLIPNAQQTADYAWLTSNECVAGADAPLVAGENVHFANARVVISAPETARYLYLRVVWNSVTYYPSYFGRYKTLIDVEKETFFQTGEAVNAKGITDVIKANNNDMVEGKAVYNFLKSNMEKSIIDVSSLLDTSRQNRWIDGNYFSSSTTGKHVAIPVLDSYEKISITAHASRASYYVFVKSYTIPTGADLFDLCEGQTGRKSVASNTTATIDIPGDCKYVIIGILNDSNNSFKPQKVTFTSYEMVNLNERLKDLFANTLRSKYNYGYISGDEYWGDLINISEPNRKHYCSHRGLTISGIGSYTPSGGTSKSQQGLAIYDKYAFVTYDYGYICIVDMTTSQIISTYEMPSGVFGPNNHAGNANFTDIFYDESDQFPLLYISSYLENCCYVLRVTLEGCSLVQTIYVSLDDTDTIHTETWHFYPDNDGRIIVHGSYGFYLGVLPKIGNATAFVHIPQCTILRNVASGYTIAGAAARNGNLYMNAYTGSTGNWDYSTLLVYNYEQKRLASKLIYPSNIHNHEFEGIAFYNNNEIVVGYNGWDRFMAYRF